MTMTTDRDRVRRAIDNAIAGADLAANGAYTHLTGMYTEHVINGLAAAGYRIIPDHWICQPYEEEQRNDHDD